ncbi:MAG: redox-regulated ATPase YchF [Candidatus Aenigmatarchaeota archaeon]
MMQIGIVGKSNTGKSTVFKAATLVDIEISNRIFTTIKPNQAVAYATAPCPCKKLGVTCKPQNSKCVSGVRMIPIKLIDVAGLVPDAHKGRGLGIQFLNDLMDASMLIHVIDLSGGTDVEGNPIKSGTHDPEDDIKFLPHEIDHWMFSIMSKNWPSIKKKAESTREPLEKLIYNQLSGLGVTPLAIEDALRETNFKLSSSNSDLLEFISCIREKSKPIIIAGNKIDVSEAKANYERLKSYEITPTSAESELALREAEAHKLIEYVPGEKDFRVVSDVNEKQKRALEFIKKNVLDSFGSTGVQQVINKGVFDVLDMIVVYPVANIGKMADKKGNVLPDAHLVRKGTTLKEFAYKIHQEIGDAFAGGLDTQRKKLGADHVLKNGDIVEIVTR